MHVNIALRKKIAFKHRLSLRNFPTVSCQNTCNVYINNLQYVLHQSKYHESQTQAVDRYDTFSMKAIRIGENYLKFLPTFLNLTEMALNEFCGVTVHIHPRGVWQGDILRKQKPTAKRLVYTLLNKSAR